MKRIRFSLLSLLVGVVLAGGVGWLNVRKPPVLYATAQNRAFYAHSYGWPFVTYFARPEEPCPTLPPLDDPEIAVYRQKIFELMWLGPPKELHWQWPGLAANIAIGLAIPIAALLACEFALRRWGRKDFVGR